MSSELRQSLMTYVCKFDTGSRDEICEGGNINTCDKRSLSGSRD